MKTLEDFMTETLGDRVARVKEDFKKLKKLSTKDLRTIIKQRDRIVDVSGFDKQGAISDILRAQFGDKAVDKAFKL